MYVHLSGRGGAATLWALGCLGFKWDGDFTRSCRSLPPPEGKLVQPLQLSVEKFFLQRGGALREQDYSVALYSLARLLGVRRLSQHSAATASDNSSSNNTMRKAVWDKLDKRVEKLATFFSSRSVSQALYGLARTGVLWEELPAKCRISWEAALLSCPSLSPSEMESGAADVGEGVEFRKPRGMKGMQRLQFAQTIFSLGSLRFMWFDMSAELQQEIYKNLEKHFAHFSLSTNELSQFDISDVESIEDASDQEDSDKEKNLTVFYLLEGLLRMEFPAGRFPSSLLTIAKLQMDALLVLQDERRELSQKIITNMKAFERCLYYCKGRPIV